MPCQKLAAQPTLRLRVTNFVEKLPNVGTDSHPRCTQGNRVLVANVDVVMTIVNTNFALNKLKVNVTATLFRVSAAPYVNVRSIRSVRVWV